MAATLLRRGAEVMCFVVVMSAALTADGDRPTSPPPSSPPPSRPPPPPPPPPRSGPQSKAGGEGVGRPPASGHCSNQTVVATGLSSRHQPAAKCSGNGETCRNDLCFCDVSDTEWRWNRCTPWTAGGNVNCAPLDSDPSNCGGCGHACSSSKTCSKGTCMSCPKTTAHCNVGDPMYDHCADLMTTDTDCGKCGHACRQGLTCIRGHCEE